MKKRVQILLFTVFMGLAVQTVASFLFDSNFQTEIVEGEAKKNEKNSKLEKDKIFESLFLQEELSALISLEILLKVEFKSALFYATPERPPNLG